MCSAHTHRQYWTSKVHCRSGQCCSPLRSHRIQSRRLLPRCEAPAARFPTADTAGWETPGQSGKERDAQKMHSSSWSDSGRPSLGINTDEDAGREGVGALSQIPADVKPYFGWRELSTGLTSCKRRFNSRLRAQTRPTPKCIQQKVTDVKVHFVFCFFVFRGALPPDSATMT